MMVKKSWSELFTQYNGSKNHSVNSDHESIKVSLITNSYHGMNNYYFQEWMNQRLVFRVMDQLMSIHSLLIQKISFLSLSPSSSCSSLSLALSSNSFKLMSIMMIYSFSSFFSNPFTTILLNDSSIIIFIAVYTVNFTEELKRNRHWMTHTKTMKCNAVVKKCLSTSYTIPYQDCSGIQRMVDRIEWVKDNLWFKLMTFIGPVETIFQMIGISKHCRVSAENFMEAGWTNSRGGRKREWDLRAVIHILTQILGKD